MNPSQDWLRRHFPEFRGRAIGVALGCLICQMGLGLTYVRTGMSADLIEGLDLSVPEFSGASLPQLIVQALAGPIVGILTIRLGASRVLAASAAIFAAVFVYFSQVDSLAGYYVAIGGVGLAAAGMGDITVGHIVSQWFKRNRGLALGIAYAGSNLGGSLMVLLTGSVAGLYGWREGLFAVVPVALFVLLPTALFMVREPAIPAEDSSPAPTDGAQGASGLDPGDPPDLDLQGALRTKSFWILTLTLFTFFFYFTGVLEHFVLFLTRNGMDRGEARVYFSQAIGLGVVSKVAGGFIWDRVAPERSVQAVYGLLAASSLVLLALPDPRLVPVFVLSWGFSQACRDVVYPIVLGRCFGDRYLGEIYGAMMITLLPGGVLGPIFGAFILDRFDTYAPAFATFAVGNVLAFGALFLIGDERKQERSAA